MSSESDSFCDVVIPLAWIEAEQRLKLPIGSKMELRLRIFNDMNAVQYVDSMVAQTNNSSQIANQHSWSPCPSRGLPPYSEIPQIFQPSTPRTSGVINDSIEERRLTQYTNRRSQTTVRSRLRSPTRSRSPCRNNEEFHRTHDLNPRRNSLNQRPPSNCLFIGGLSCEDVRLENVQHIFATKRPQNISMPFDIVTRKFKGFCFIHFNTVDEAVEAFKDPEIRRRIFSLSGNHITIDFSKNRNHVNV